MIQNPHATFFRYDPYMNKIYAEYYDLDDMKMRRGIAIRQLKEATHIGLVMGTLGRQGSPHILKQLETILTEAHKKYSMFLMSDVSPQALLKYPQIDAWIEIACPRLAIDWGDDYPVPLLNPYECFVAMKDLPMDYPMDNYMYNGGEWSVYTAKEIS